jgi:hypothetical protein
MPVPMPYRDDLEALEHRCRSLEAESATLGAELAAARQLLEEGRARRRLPVLDDLRIAAPCSADWSYMLGDERVRFCGQCEKNVYNLSEMTRAEAEALLAAKEGKLCVRYYRRTDGTILTTDCPVGTQRRRRRRRVVAFAFGAMSALTAAGAALFSRSSTKLAITGASVVDGGAEVAHVPVGAAAKSTVKEQPRAYQERATTGLPWIHDPALDATEAGSHVVHRKAAKHRKSSR